MNAASTAPRAKDWEMKPGFDVRIGINPISWSNDDLPSLGGETPLDVALAEGAAIGYQGFELGNKFPREARALRDVLAPHRLALVSGWYSGRLARRGVDEEIAAVGPHLRLLAEVGAKVMVYGEVADSIQGARVPLYKRPRFARATQWREYGERMTAFAKYTLDHGVRLAYHHHMRGNRVRRGLDRHRDERAASGERAALLRLGADASRAADCRGHAELPVPGEPRGAESCCHAPDPAGDRLRGDPSRP